MATASSDEISPQFVNSFRPETFLQNIFFFGNLILFGLEISKKKDDRSKSVSDVT